MGRPRRCIPWNKNKRGLQHHSPESLEKLRRASSAENNPMFGRHHSEETRQKISKAREGKLTGKYSLMTEDVARKILDEFEKSPHSLVLFSRKFAYWPDKLSIVFRKYFPDEYDAIQERKWSRRSLWYQKGRTFEYRVRDYLKKKGFWVLRSPRSGSPIDLVAIKKNTILLIQCKLSADRIGKSQKQEILEICDTTGARGVLAFRPEFRKIKFRELHKEGYLDFEIL